MNAFRRGVIVLVNAAVLLLVLKVVLFDETNDGVGAFGIAAFIFLFIYNVYALVIYNTFWENPRRLISIELVYVVLLILPVLFLWSVTAW